jgi:hypothetical protein
LVAATYTTIIEASVGIIANYRLKKQILRIFKLNTTCIKSLTKAIANINAIA